jgi:HlyD family secretion protein
MKTILNVLILLLVLAGLGSGGYFSIQQYLAQLNKVAWRTEKVAQGNIRAVVNSTGTVQPKLKVAIGSFVSGPIVELNAEFNQEVKKGDLLARIDPLTYEAIYTRDKASLASRMADVAQVKVQLQQAVNDEKRALTLHAKDPSFIASSEMDKFRFARMSLEAQLNASETAVDQAKATAENSLANVNYTKIAAPVDGMIINRKIDLGQTVAAQFQTPELFVIAPDMRVEMHVNASVDEADIGLIKTAQLAGFPVRFTVDAYPDELFEGRVHEVRLNSATTQNVVTYPVIVAAPNPDLKLLPGMTANLSFQVAFREHVIKIPNAALRFYPNPKHVRPEDHPILEGQRQETLERDDEAAGYAATAMSADERNQVRRNRDHRHVWVLDNQKLRAVPVTTGLSDSHYTEMVDGPLKPEDIVVIGIEVPLPGTSR